MQTRHDPATGCLIWLGETKPRPGGPEPRLSIKGQRLSARRVVARAYHQLDLPPCQLEAICGAALGPDRRSVSLCVSPFHAAPRSPRRLAKRLGATPQDLQALMATLRGLAGRSPSYPLRWDATDLPSVACDRDTLRSFARDNRTDYWLAWAAWANLLRLSVLALRRERGLPLT